MKHHQLLNLVQLEKSPVVANNRMNRERILWGTNSYQKELGRVWSSCPIDFRGFLTAQSRKHDVVRWMDLCCGSGNALIQAAKSFHETDESGSVRFEGLDLAGMFSIVPEPLKATLQLRVGSTSAWAPSGDYDLISCIHGIHYVGDKLGLLRKAIASLRPDGLLIANLDPENLKDTEGKSLHVWWKTECLRNGWKYSTRRHLLQVVGRQDWSVTCTYLGADDQAGPNYTGQPAVNSYYEVE
jgi:SAM-dependent methyltransferase